MLRLRSGTFCPNTTQKLRLLGTGMVPMVVPGAHGTDQSTLVAIGRMANSAALREKRASARVGEKAQIVASCVCE